MVKDVNKVRKTYQKKIADLIKIRDSKYPAAMSQELYEAHERKVDNATIYLDELDSIEAFVRLERRIIISTLDEINRFIETADYSNAEFDGEYVKLYILQKFGYPDMWLLYMAPLKVL